MLTWYSFYFWSAFTWSTMPPWIMKAAIQGVLSHLPNPQRWNHLFQKHVTRSVNLRESYFTEKWKQCSQHVAQFDQSARSGDAMRSGSAGFVALEIGTGWFPIIPIGLALSGAKRVYSVDTQTLLAHERVVQTLQQYRNGIVAERLEGLATDALQSVERLLGEAHQHTASELLSQLGIETLVADARTLPLPAESVDLVCSNNTLEHIPRAVIEGIFTEFHRVIRRDGLMSHHIDLADHYAEFDRSISVYNFLRYSDRTWRLFNNELQYQNRLRVSDFREIHRETGWHVIHERALRQAPEVLQPLRLAERFEKYDASDLLVYDVWFTSRKAER